MKQRLPIILIIFLCCQLSLTAQQETYTVTKAPFSSDKYDEYSPVFYKNGIVFSSNRGSGSFVDYSSSGGIGTFEICYIDTTKKITWRKSGLFSKSLKTPLNDGPVTFNKSGDTIYFSRNLQVEGKFSDLSTGRNKLGIFSAVLDGKNWTKIRELRFNNEWYNVTTPWLSPDGKKLYFASDKSGGYGGSDLYFSEWKGDYWGDPVNLGPVINTSGNEAYPFINSAGDLYFASDGHPGMGGKDIFFSRFADTTWLPIVHLNPPVNSEYDDFGIITDSLLNSGYFSSGRGKSNDIYHFRTNMPQIFYSDLQRENQYCFKFNEEGNIRIDNNLLRYEWNFGDGSKAAGQIAEHCFPGPGTYMVKLNLIDRNTGRELFTKLSYNLDLKDVEQPYINSPYAAIVGEELSFDGLRSNLPGYEILSYMWQFSKGERATGASVKHKFEEQGPQEVKLGLIIRQTGTGIISQRSVSKKISVFNTRQEATSYAAKVKESTPKVDIRDYDHAFINTLYSAENELTQDAVFLVELANTKTRLGINSATFKNIPLKYKVREIFLPDENSYSYVVDREMDLMATLPAYNDMISLGFKNTRIRTYPIKDPAEKEIYDLKQLFGVSADTYFDNNNRLTSNGYLLLDQIVRVLTKYPGAKFEIEVHTDNSWTPENNLNLSKWRAQLMVNYLINKGIDGKRLSGIGLGSVRPIASNYTEAGKKLNRRIDFTIVMQ
ncbi:MAG: PKD domain-containing protein [Bacteroidales bacterium]|jgi:outer membrane protein OmpA-like peptidoglycan-associated protein|nr:PKD domain-containing protein [Bacteroidales bacterium]